MKVVAKEAIQKLKEAIAWCRENEDPNVVDWGSQQGVLMTANDAAILLEAYEKPLIEYPECTHEFEKMRQQMTGWMSNQDGETISQMVDAAGLTKDEYLKHYQEWPIDEGFRQELDEHFGI